MEDLNKLQTENVAGVDRLERLVRWVPVTAALPKPEQMVLAYFRNEHGKDRRIRAFYAPRLTVETGTDDDWFEYSETQDNYFLPEGWYEANEFEDTHWFVDGGITHWMALPEPPNALAQPTAPGAELSKTKADCGRGSAGAQG